MIRNMIKILLDHLKIAHRSIRSLGLMESSLKTEKFRKRKRKAFALDFVKTLLNYIVSQRVRSVNFMFYF